MFVQLKGTYKSSQHSLNINSDHVSIVFNRQERVILRMIDGMEVTLDPSYKDAIEVTMLLCSEKVIALVETVKE
jgi:hypothetical protein